MQGSERPKIFAGILGRATYRPDNGCGVFDNPIGERDAIEDQPTDVVGADGAEQFVPRIAQRGNGAVEGFSPLFHGPAKRGVANVFEVLCDFAGAVTDGRGNALERKGDLIALFLRLNTELF